MPIRPFDEPKFGYTKLNPPTGMVDMFTTPRKPEFEIVKKLLRENGIKYRTREEQREHGWRYCLYVPKASSKKAYTVIDEGLSELGM